jgi:hypothetical protein
MRLRLLVFPPLHADPMIASGFAAIGKA